MRGCDINSKRRQFVEENYETLEKYASQLNDDYRPILGFGCCSPLSTFDEVLKERDYYFLPLCFLQIFWELETTENNNFIRRTLKGLYKFDENGDISDPVMAYVYAYILCHTNGDEDEESFAIVEKLGNQCFPPALATLGDACVSRHELDYAGGYYKHAAQHRYDITTGIRYKVAIIDTTGLEKMLIRGKWILEALYNLPRIMFKGLKGEHALYLSFYGTRYHLNEYEKKSNSERVTKRKQRIAEMKNSKTT